MARWLWDPTIPAHAPENREGRVVFWGYSGPRGSKMVVPQVMQAGRLKYGENRLVIEGGRW